MGVGGEVMGTIQGDHGPIPHCTSAFLADIDPASFLKWSNIAILGGIGWNAGGGSRGGSNGDYSR